MHNILPLMVHTPMTVCVCVGVCVHSRTHVHTFNYRNGIRHALRPFLADLNYISVKLTRSRH